MAVTVIVCIGNDQPQVCEIERLTATNRIRWVTDKGPLARGWDGTGALRPTMTDNTVFQVDRSIFPYDPDLLERLKRRQDAFQAAERVLDAAKIVYRQARAQAEAEAGATGLDGRETIVLMGGQI